MLLALWCGLAAASTFAEVQLPELVDASDAVVRVEVQTLRTVVDQVTGLVTSDVTVAVTDSFYGPYLMNSNLVIREVGGEVDGYVTAAVGFPAFQPGADLVVFLNRWPDGTPRVAEYGAGFYAVVPSTVGPVLIPGPLQDAAGHATTPNAPVPHGTSLQDFVTILYAEGGTP
jgi:hypothetical protein